MKSHCPRCLSFTRGGKKVPHPHLHIPHTAHAHAYANAENAIFKPSNWISHSKNFRNKIKITLKYIRNTHTTNHIKYECINAEQTVNAFKICSKNKHISTAMPEETVLFIIIYKSFINYDVLCMFLVCFSFFLFLSCRSYVLLMLPLVYIPTVVCVLSALLSTNQMENDEVSSTPPFNVSHKTEDLNTETTTKMVNANAEEAKTWKQKKNKKMHRKDAKTQRHADWGKRERTLFYATETSDTINYLVIFLRLPEHKTELCTA